MDIKEKVSIESRTEIEGIYQINQQQTKRSIETDEEIIDTYIKHIEKLPSIGPLNITDLQEFLVKSKIDFEHLFKDKSVSKLKITDFNLIRKLGSGAFGKVILAEHKEDSSLYAIKLIEKRMVIQKKQVRYVSNEKRILQSINFPFVVYLKYFFIDFNFLYIVMPYVPGGSFHHYIQKKKPLKEPIARFYIAQLILALEYLHYLELIHRDVKPENIMIDALGYLKLGDFGQCIRCRRNDRTWSITGTPEYMAPEIISGRGYDYSVDWWALAVITYEICAGHRPFKHENIEKLYKVILNAKYIIPREFSRHLVSFISHLLVLDPNKRITQFKGSSKIKSHAWVKDTDWLALLNRTVAAPYLPEIQAR